MMMLRSLSVMLAVSVLCGCAAYYPSPDRSAERAILDTLQPTAANPSQSVGATPAPTSTPPAVSDLLLPRLSGAPTARTARAEERFDFVVSGAPINQVLSGLAAGTDWNILLREGTAAPRPVVRENSVGGAGRTSGAMGTNPTEAESGTRTETKISLNLKNVTVLEVLEALRELYGYDYTVEGRRILVQAATLQTRLFQVNYVAGERRGASDLQVISGASASSTEGFASVQASGLSTSFRANLWNETEDALRTLLGCLIPTSGAGGGAGGGLGGGRAGAGGAGGSGAGGTSTRRADVLPPQGEVPENERLRGIEGCPEGRAITVNAMTGTIVVRAMPAELREVERLLRTTELRIARQVIIEAKIIDVELNSESQQGINWAAFRDGQFRVGLGMSASAISVNQGVGGTGTSGGSVLGATTSLQQLLGNTLIGSGNATAFTQGLGMAVQASNFSTLLNFLETQGKVHVLSNPRISTLNNQKAVIKVGNEEPFVTNITGGSQSVAQGGVVSEIPPTLTYQPFFSGLALDVTPQIDDAGNITLHVHSMVNSVVEKQKIALPNAQTTVPFAVNTINETDSVVRATDGQLVVIAGLMTEGTSDNRAGVPIVRQLPGAGGLFNRGAQRATKRELVILMKPTVVRDNGTWDREISDVNERIRSLEAGPSARPRP